MYTETLWARNGRETVSLTSLLVTLARKLNENFLVYFNRRSALGVFPVGSFCIRPPNRVFVEAQAPNRVFLLRKIFI